MKRLDPFRDSKRDLKPLGDVLSDVIPTKPDRIGIDHVFLDEDGEARRAATHVDTGGTKLLLVLDQRGHARHISRRGKPCEFQIAALEAVDQILENGAVGSEHVHITGKPLADLTSRVDQSRAMVEREIHRLRMKDVTTVTDIRHVAGGQRPGDVMFADNVAFDRDDAREAVGARLPARETGDDVVDSDIRHFLSGLNSRPDCALGLVNRTAFAEFDPARPGRCCADHPKLGLSGHVADPLTFWKRIDPVEPKDQTGHLGGAYIENGNDTALYGGAAHGAHRALAVIEIRHSVSLPNRRVRVSTSPSIAASESLRTGRRGFRKSIVAMSRARRSCAASSAMTR